MKEVTVIIGDGISEEISPAAMKVIKYLVPDIVFDVKRAGIDVYEKTGSLMEEGLLESVEKNKVALKGPIGTPIGKGFRSINVELRKRFDLYANIRPIKTFGDFSRYENVDLVVFRENTEDLYAGIEKEISKDEMHSIKVITRRKSERIARKAFEYAVAHNRKKVTIVTKANIMKLTDGLFLDVAREMSEKYPGVETEEILIDNMCMQLVIDPSRYDIILTQNLYGDILSDLCAGLVGGLGLAPSANLGEKHAIFEAVHGTAPDIAGKNIANPAALIMSATMMLEHMGYRDESERLNVAIRQVLQKKEQRTRDLGGLASTTEFTDYIMKYS
ncbi:MAG TPA: isocitrate/isopropylmalate dehydrogenase family protein [Bacillota bacterium]|nr:isocitrate/isopropylmalate dehydrogenase family protein [Bacillota bacterium]HQC48981.1 isocitrate/isopropylmalate dehydrogenase family protein [Bacillota bacterium]